MSDLVRRKTFGVAKVMTVLGILLLALFLGVGFWKLYDRMQHAGQWRATTADVTWAGEACQMASKSGKSWVNADVVPCGDVETYKVQHSDRTWRSTPSPFVTLVYEAGGSRQEVLASGFAAPLEATAIGAKAAIFVDPAEPQRFDRALDDRDYREFGLIALMGVGALVASVLLGSVIARLNARAATKGKATVA